VFFLCLASCVVADKINIEIGASGCSRRNSLEASCPFNVRHSTIHYRDVRLDGSVTFYAFQTIFGFPANRPLVHGLKQEAKLRTEGVIRSCTIVMWTASKHDLGLRRRPGADEKQIGGLSTENAETGRSTGSGRSTIAIR
jgi:hypothetical protein